MKRYFSALSGSPTARPSNAVITNRKDNNLRAPLFIWTDILASSGYCEVVLVLGVYGGGNWKSFSETDIFLTNLLLPRWPSWRHAVSINLDNFDWMPLAACSSAAATPSHSLPRQWTRSCC